MAGQLEKMVIKNTDTNEEFRVQFNPERYSIERASTWEEKGKQAKSIRGHQPAAAQPEDKRQRERDDDRDRTSNEGPGPGQLSNRQRLPSSGARPHLFFPLRARRCRRWTRRTGKNEMKREDVTMVYRVASLGLLLLAYGCTVGPNYQRSDVPVASTWKEASQSGIDTRSAELTRWWTAFNDPLLNSLVERAVRSNLDLRLAEARIREARASRGVIAADAWPTLDISGSYSRSRASENAFSEQRECVRSQSPGRRRTIVLSERRSGSEFLSSRLRRQLGDRRIRRCAAEC